MDNVIDKFHVRYDSDEYLLQVLRDYNDTVGFPTQRRFNTKNGLPSYTTYFKRFGSFQNAILISGIKIPQNRMKYFNRVEMSDDELLLKLKNFTIQHLKTNIYLPTNKVLESCNSIPSMSVYNKRFGGMNDMFKCIGYDYDDFNLNAKKTDMINKYKELCAELGHTANSREIDKASIKNDGYYYSCSTYINNFGNISELQKQIGVELSGNVIGKTKEEMLVELKRLADELGYPPFQKDIDECKYTSSSNKYTYEFGGILNALEMIGFNNIKSERKQYYTKNGTKCLSFYEYSFCTMLEDYGVEYAKEEYYSKYITGFDKKYRFDFVVNVNNKKYPIEIFGITGVKEYDLKTKEKIKLCFENEIALICLFSEDFTIKNSKTLYKKMLNKIEDYELKILQV